MKKIFHKSIIMGLLTVFLIVPALNYSSVGLLLESKQSTPAINSQELASGYQDLSLSLSRLHFSEKQQEGRNIQQQIGNTAGWTFSTFFGGSNDEYDGFWSGDVAVDSAGNVIVAGHTQSSDLPTKNAYQENLSGGWDAFVAKFSSDGQTQIFVTYFGGTDTDYCHSVAIDAANNIVVIGITHSTDFPTKNPFKENLEGDYDAFLAKFSPDGSLIFSTFYGGTDGDYGDDLIIDAAGNIIFSLHTSSYLLPTLNAFQEDFHGLSDAYVAKLAADGQSLLFGTYIGGTGTDGGIGLVVDASGNIVLMGHTMSSDFPTANAFQSNLSGVNDAFIAKFSLNGTLLFSTFLGGSGDERPFDMGIDASGNIVVVGGTPSLDFPLANAFQENKERFYDTYITKFTPDGQSLVFSTFFGGNDYEKAIEVFIDQAGDIFITGHTQSGDFPIVNAFQGSIGGGYDAFLTKFSADGQTLLLSSFLGDADDDWGGGVVVDTNGSIVIAGATSSSDFPVVNAFQENLTGGYDVFICKFASEITSTKNASLPNLELLFAVFGLASIVILVTRRRRLKLH